jgi:hypothetical protein
MSESSIRKAFDNSALDVWICGPLTLFYRFPCPENGQHALVARNIIRNAQIAVDSALETFFTEIDYRATLEGQRPLWCTGWFGAGAGRLRERRLMGKRAA